MSDPVPCRTIGCAAVTMGGLVPWCWDHIPRDVFYWMLMCDGADRWGGLLVSADGSLHRDELMPLSARSRTQQTLEQVRLSIAAAIAGEGAARE